MALDVATLCLGLLSRHDATGYELKKEFEEGPISYYLDASFGSIYPALNRMLAEGLVICRMEEGARGPDRKVYSISPDGEAALAKALEADPSRERHRMEFLFFLAFEHLLKPGHAAAIVDSQIADQKSKLAKLREMDDCFDDTGRCFGLGYGLAILEASIRYLEDNRHLMAADDTAVSDAALEHNASAGR